MRDYIFLFGYIIFLTLIEKVIINKFNIRKKKGLFKHFNKFHKWAEILLITGIILVLFIDAFYSFVLLILLLSFRAFMEWKFEKESKTYILNILNSGEFLLLLIIIKAKLLN